jgi:hypothetical protein
MPSQLFMGSIFAFVICPLISVLAADALPGRIGAYSARHVRHMTGRQKSTYRGHNAVASSREHRLKRALGHIGNSVKRLAGSKIDKRLARVAHAGTSSGGRTFLWQVPADSHVGASIKDVSQQMISQAFTDGLAKNYSPEALRQAHVFDGSSPLRGGIYLRRESVQYLILHSTETGRPADAPRVIASWNKRGLRHAGAQFVVDRDGTIYNTVDPAYATVHVNTHKTIAGIDNDNTVGIEIVHTGNQIYTDQQIQSAARLVTYLQERYSIAADHVLTHHYVQPSDRTDPVNFNWNKFAMDRSLLGNIETAMCRKAPAVPAFGATESPLAGEQSQEDLD